MNKKTFLFGALALCVATVSLAMEREKKQGLKLLNYKNILDYSAKEILNMCTLSNKANPLGKENQNLSQIVFIKYKKKQLYSPDKCSEKNQLRLQR